MTAIQTIYFGGTCVNCRHNFHDQAGITEDHWSFSATYVRTKSASRDLILRPPQHHNSGNNNFGSIPIIIVLAKMYADLGMCRYPAGQETLAFRTSDRLKQTNSLARLSKPLYLEVKTEML